MRQGTKIGIAALGLALLIVAGLTGLAGANKGDTVLISRATGLAGVKGNTDSGTQGTSLSRDGNAIAFESQADNISTSDGDTTPDIFVRDVGSATTTLVSRATGGAGAKGNMPSGFPSISADGNFVVFESLSTNLDPDDAVNSADIYVRDLQNNTTTLVSRAPGAAGAKGNGVSFGASISEDGQYVAFVSTSTNLDPDDAETGNDVYVRDLVNNTIKLVSRADGAVGANADGITLETSISDDGQRVAFYATSTNLDPADTFNDQDVYVRDILNNNTILVSRADGAAGAKGDSASSVLEDGLSGDGNHVAFVSNADNLDAADGDATLDVYERDLVTDQTTLVSRATGVAGTKGNGGEYFAAASDDGRYVSFVSESDNLHPDDPANDRGVYVRDVLNNTTTLVSRATGTSGEPANAVSSFRASISGDGRYVGFSSAATNLHPDDSDTGNDVYRRDVTGPLADPVQAENVVVEPVVGTVKVKRPGSSLFVTLREGDSIPVGSQLDTRAGTVELTSAKNTVGDTQTARFKFGLFRVTQAASTGAFTELTMTGPKVCKHAAGFAAAAGAKSFKKKKKGKGRKLWGSGHGKFKSNGSKGSGSASGTTWQVTDRCDGKTEIRSIKGTVTARDNVRKRTVILHTGERYIAPGKKKPKKH